MMTEQHTGHACRSAVRSESADSESSVDREMPLLAAIAREIGVPGDDITSRLPAAYALLRNAFQSIDRPRVLKDVA